MDLLINALKGQANSMNLILFTGLLSYIFHKSARRRAGLISGVFTLIFFFLFSTNYLPGYLIGKLESEYQPFKSIKIVADNVPVYIQVLGGGYVQDERLPSQAQLSYATLGRLAEAIRILHQMDGSILVVSGNVASGTESMALVAKKAAMGLGVDEGRVEMLEGPSTTMEEARAFAARFGSSSPVIIVTDAVHMPRAMRFFNNEGLKPYAAPTNYYIKADDNPFAFRWVPSAENFLLMDRVLREFFGSVKGAIG